MVRRVLRQRLGAVVVGTLALLAASCVPSPDPAPPLPSGTGVQWLRDVGGALNPDGDTYLAELRRWTKLDGVTTGPVVPTHAATPATIADMGWTSNPASMLDGTAMQPWNGFAGENISLDSVAFADDEWLIQFPGGSCSLGESNPFSYVTMLSPSPDGSAAAAIWREDGPVWHVVTYELTDSATCPLTQHLTYGSPNGLAGNVIVWSPDSTAILYAVASGADSRLVRLDIATAAITDVVAPTSSRLLPLGWSIADRILYRTAAPLPDGRLRTTLITQAVGGGAGRVIDTSTGPPEWIAAADPSWFAHFGYFVPGTTTICYGDGSANVTNADGITFPLFDIRLVADATNAASKTIHSDVQPVSWHPLPAFDSPTPLGPTTDAPNAEFVERFVH